MRYLEADWFEKEVKLIGRPETDKYFFIRIPKSKSSDNIEDLESRIKSFPSVYLTKQIKMRNVMGESTSIIRGAKTPKAKKSRKSLLLD